MKESYAVPLVDHIRSSLTIVKRYIIVYLTTVK